MINFLSGRFVEICRKSNIPLLRYLFCQFVSCFHHFFYYYYLKYCFFIQLNQFIFKATVFFSFALLYFRCMTKMTLFWIISLLCFSSCPSFFNFRGVFRGPTKHQTPSFLREQLTVINSFQSSFTIAKIIHFTWLTGFWICIADCQYPLRL